MPTISTKDYLLDQAKRRITTSPFLTVAGHGRAREAAAGPRLAPACVAEPPPGSDLKPVMGDTGLPILGHMIEMFRGGPDFWLHLYRTKRAGVAARFADPSVGGGAGSRRHSGALLQPQQGLLAAGLGACHRAVLQARPDAARLRRAHVPPADHAGGVRPHPAGRLHRARRQGRLAGDRQRLGGQRRTLPAVSGDEGAHPRHRLDGVHGPRAGHRQGAGDQGEQGLHHHHARGQRDHPHQRAAVHVVARAEGPQAARGLLRGARQGAPRQGRLRPADGAVPVRGRGRQQVLRRGHRQPHDLPDDGRPRHVDVDRDDDGRTTWPPTPSGRTAAATSPTGSATARSTSRRWRSWKRSTW